jgi:hypothetical protein
VKAIALAVIALACACSVDRKSAQFACTTTEQCSDGRVCTNGFCVDTGNSSDALDIRCNSITMTCDFECTSVTPCDTACPEGYTCTYSCLQQGACDNNIDCTQAAACMIHCELANCDQIHCGGASCAISCGGIGGSCGDIHCGPGKCDVTCTNDACGDISCGSSCACDVLGCTSGNCGNLSCPNHSGHCTTDGANGSPCSSTAQPGCSSC